MTAVRSAPRRPRRRTVVGLIAGALLLSLAGASLAIADRRALESDPGAAKDPLRGPDYFASAAAVCGLLSPEDLGLALGYAYREGFEPDLTYPAFAGITGVTKCAYGQEDERGTVALGVAYAYADQVFRQTRERVVNLGGFQELPGLGSAAMYSAASGELVALADGKIVALLVPVNSEPEPMRIERARRLAETVIGRL